MILSAVRLWRALFASILCLAPLASAASCTTTTVTRVLPAASEQPQAPAQLFEVIKLVDGDTIHIRRGDKVEKLRLLSVDTEEKFSPGHRNSGTKPQTVYGEETRLWTIDFFEQFRMQDGKLRVGLRFPEDKEARDIYGRLLCHVLLTDGTDFNLLLVQLGKSPYFNKYGNSKICHQAFVAAQVAARRNLLGIWNPRTNQASTEGQPSSTRPYDRLLPWWQARADAIDNFRARSGRAPDQVISAEDPDALAAAQKRGTEVEVFCSVDRFFDEDDGSRTVLMRSSDKQRALRVRIPQGARAAFESFDLDGLREEFRQNFVYVSGVVVEGSRGFQIETSSPDPWKRAGAEPQ